MPYDIIEFDIVDVLGSIIENNVVDIKKDRKGKRWVFPTFTKNAALLPQITIDTSNPTTYEDDSAGDFLYSSELDNGNIVEVFYKKASKIVHCFILTNKEGEFEVNVNGNILNLNGKLSNSYLSKQVFGALQQNKSEILKHVNKLTINNVSPTFEDDKYRWVSDIELELQYNETWHKEYLNGQLIATYTKSVVLY